MFRENSIVHGEINAFGHHCDNETTNMRRQFRSQQSRQRVAYTCSIDALVFRPALCVLSLWLFFSGDDNVRTRGTPWPSRAANAARALVLLGQSIGGGVARSAPRSGELWRRDVAVSWSREVVRERASVRCCCCASLRGVAFLVSPLLFQSLLVTSSSRALPVSRETFLPRLLPVSPSTVRTAGESPWVSYARRLR